MGFATLRDKVQEFSGGSMMLTIFGQIGHELILMEVAGLVESKHGASGTGRTGPRLRCRWRCVS